MCFRCLLDGCIRNNNDINRKIRYVVRCENIIDGQARDYNVMWQLKHDILNYVLYKHTNIYILLVTYSVLQTGSSKTEMCLDISTIKWIGCVFDTLFGWSWIWEYAFFSIKLLFDLRDTQINPFSIIDDYPCTFSPYFNMCGNTSNNTFILIWYKISIDISLIIINILLFQHTLFNSITSTLPLL